MTTPSPTETKIQNEEFLLNSRPEGVDDLQSTWKLSPCAYPSLSSSPTPSFIAESLYISVDPYLSSTIKKSALGGISSPLGTVQNSAAVSRILESTLPDWPVGMIFEARIPWRRYNHFTTPPTRFKIVKNPTENGDNNVFDQHGGPIAAITHLGMPSQTAFYAATQVMTLKKSDILLVSGAMGAVGHVMVQIAKKCLEVSIVIGTAGGKEKCDKLLSLGCDFAIDYKEYDTEDKVSKRILELTKGIPPNQYFDNTGGHVTDAFFSICARKSFICVCGQIASYNQNEKESRSYPNYLAKTIYKHLTIQGFVWSDYQHQNEEKYYPQMMQWIKEGKFQFEDTIIKGFENLPAAYQILYTGKNFGKIVVDCTNGKDSGKEKEKESKL